jgi:hypothetical protein
LHSYRYFCPCYHCYRQCHYSYFCSFSYCYTVVLFLFLWCACGICYSLGPRDDVRTREERTEYQCTPESTHFQSRSSMNFAFLVVRAELTQRSKTCNRIKGFQETAT